MTEEKNSYHWLCENNNATKANIDLKVFDDLPTCKTLERSDAKELYFLLLDCSPKWIMHVSKVSRL